MDAPTAFPSGETFLQVLLRLLAPSAKIGEALVAASNPFANLERNAGHFLRFEGVMEHLAASFDPELKALDYFDLPAPPNDLHAALAQLLARYVPVLTTNFDNCIERSCQQAGIPITQVYERSGFEQFVGGRLESSPLLFKLHGTFRDLDNNSVRSSIRATLARVGQANGALGLDPEFRQTLDRILQRYDLVVSGYSGWDDFDIGELLRSTDSARQLIWIRHVPPQTFFGKPRLLNWKNIDQIVQKYMARSRVLPRDLQILYELGTFGRRPPHRLWLIIAPTRFALAKLFPDYFKPAPASSHRFVENKVKKFLLAWMKAAGLTRAGRWQFCGLLFDGLSDYDNAAHCYRLALYWAKKHRQLDIVNALNQNLLALYTDVENFAAARELVAQMEKSNAGQSPRNEAYQCNSLARFYEALAVPGRALYYYRRAFKAARLAGEKPLLVTIAHNIGNYAYVRGKTKSAQRWLRRARDYAQQAPDLQTLADALVGLAHIDDRMGLTDDMNSKLNQAESLFVMLGDLAGEFDVLLAKIEAWQPGGAATAEIEALIKRATYLAGVLQNLYLRGVLHEAVGNWHRLRGEYAEAQADFDRALSDLTTAGSRDGQLAVLNAKGFLAVDQNDLDLAEKIFYQALLLSQELSEWIIRSDILYKLAEIAASRQEWPITLQWLTLALTANRRVASVEGETNCLRLRAEVYAQQNERAAMAADLAQAENLASKLQYKVPHARVHRTAAHCAMMLDDWPEAGRQAESALNLFQQTRRWDEVIVTVTQTMPALKQHWTETQLRALMDSLIALDESLTQKEIAELQKIFGLSN